jgi:hypothetical protein
MIQNSFNSGCSTEGSAHLAPHVKCLSHNAYAVWSAYVDHDGL